MRNEEAALVVAVDDAARKMEVIGGNVLQSVTLRKMKLDARGRLSRQYDPARYKVRSRDCRMDAGCDSDNLNVQHWGVLLQLR